MRNILIRSIRYQIPCYITSSHFNDCLRIEPLKLLLLEAKLGFSAVRWWYFLWGKYPGLMLKIEMVLKSFASGLPWRKYPRAPTWLSKTGLLQCLASRQPVQVPGGFVVCSTLCKGLGETAQVAAFHGLLHVWSCFSRVKALWAKAYLQPCVWGLWSHFHLWCWTHYSSKSCSYETLRKKNKPKPKKPTNQGKTFSTAGISQPWLWVGSIWTQITCSPIWILFLDMNSHLLPGRGIPSRALHSYMAIQRGVWSKYTLAHLSVLSNNSYV